VTRDQGAATGQQPHEPGRCECRDLEPLHVISATTKKRGACSNSNCGCRRYEAAEDEPQSPVAGDTIAILRATLAKAEASCLAGWVCCEYHHDRPNGLPCDGACCDQCPGVAGGDQ
jgi:hypothetical protein